MLCLRKLPIAKKVMDERGYQDFPSKAFFVSECQKIP